MIRRLACLALMTLAIGCSPVGRVQYENNKCFIDGQAATVADVDARLTAVSQRIMERQPWFAVVTLFVILIAGASNVDKLLTILRARHEGHDRPWNDRLRDALQRQRQRPVRYFAIVGTLTSLLALAVAFYIYLDADKRASERALGMLQFCNRELKNDEERLALDEQRRNLAASQSTAGDIRALVDKLPPEEQRKGQMIVDQMNVGLQRQGKIVSDYLTRSDEAAKQLLEHTADVQKGLSTLQSDVAMLKVLPSVLRDISGQVQHVDGRVGDEAGKLAGLEARLGDIDGELKKLLARPVCEPPKPSPPVAAAGKPIDMR
jgi:hypothetical protein